MTREWEYTDTYVCACGHISRSYRLGKNHEENCADCQRILRGEDEPEEDDDADN